MRPLISLLLLATATLAAPPEPKFRAVTLDDKVQIGYGVAVADVDGDGHPDILLADKKQFVWYRNPGGVEGRGPKVEGAPPAPPSTLDLRPSTSPWTRYILAENLTAQDNVCLAAQDIDGDGKCEIAVGAEWNPSDTEKSGAVFYLIAPADRTQPWEPVKFPSVEPTTHRMKWVKLGEVEGRGPKVEGAPPAPPSALDIRLSTSSWGLVVVPLHGRGNKNGEGAPVKVLLYHPPVGDPHGEWKSEVIDESMHMTHNFDIQRFDNSGDVSLRIAGREAIYTTAPKSGLKVQGWSVVGAEQPDRFGAGPESVTPEFKGAGEIRHCALGGGRMIFATVEPMHGNKLVTYSKPKTEPTSPFGPLDRHVLTDKLIEGHALACGDLLGAKSDQIVVGWRGNPPGVHLWTPLDEQGAQWRDSAVDDGGMACEDLTLADLDGDGKLDIVASGRATHNLKVYFNETPR